MLDTWELWRGSLLCGGLWAVGVAFGVVVLAVPERCAFWLLVVYILGLLRLGRGLFSHLSR